MQKNGKNTDKKINLKMKTGREEAYEYFYDPRGILKGLVADIKAQNHKDFMIWGECGTGKTTMLDKIEEEFITSRKILRMRFEPKDAKIAFSKLKHSLAGFIGDALLYSGSSKTYLKDRIEDDIGDDVHILNEVFPGVADVLDILPKKYEVSFEEKEARLYRSMFHLFDIIINQRKTLLILDGIQWMDESTMELMSYLKDNLPKEKINFVCSYRGSESPKNEFSDAKWKETKVEDFSRAEVKYIADNVFENVPDELVGLIYEKTGGNPMKVKILLVYLMDMIESGREIELDVSDIQNGKFANKSFFEFLYSDMSEDFIKLVKRLAVIGMGIDVEKLKYLCCDQTSHVDKDERISENLDIGIQKNIIKLKNNVISFAHDMMGQIVLNDISDDEQRAILLEVAERMGEGSFEEFSQKVYYYMQYYSGESDIPDDIARKIVDAGNMQLANGAYREAMFYFDYIRLVMDQKRSNLCDEYMIRYYNGLVGAYYYGGKYSEIQNIVLKLIEGCEDLLDLSDVIIKAMSSLTMEGRYQDSLEFGKDMLERLDEDFDISRLQETDSYIASWIEKNRIVGLSEVKNMSDKRKSLAMKVLDQMSPAAYFSNEEKWKYVAAKRVRMTFEYGADSASAYGYSNYGIYLIGKGNPERGYSFGLAGASIANRFGDKNQLSKVYLDLGNFITPWVRDLREAESYNEVGYGIATECGEIQYAGYLMKFMLFMSLDYGENLISVRSKLQKLLKTAKTFKNRSSYDTLWGVSIILDFVIENLSIDHERERDYIESAKEHKSYYALCNYYLIKAGFLIRSGLYEEAKTAIREADRYFDSVFGTFATAQLYFYKGIVASEFGDELTLVKAMHKIEGYSLNCPENFEYKLQFLKGEYNRMKHEDDMKAYMHFYDEAIQSAKRNRFNQDVALICERVGRIYSKIEIRSMRDLMLKEASDIYLNLGYHRCVYYIENEYGLNVQRPTIRTDKSSKLNYYKATRLLNEILMVSYEYSNLNKISNRDEFLSKNLNIIANYTRSYYAAIYKVNPDSTLVEESNLMVENILKKEKIDRELLKRSMVSDRAIRYTYSNSESKPVKCVAIIPVDGENKRLLYLARSGNIKRYSDEEIKIIKLISRQLNITLENMDLIDDLNKEIDQRRAAEGELQEKQVQLHELNRDLEAMVEKRTKDLKDTIHEMELMHDDLLQAKKISSLSQIVIGVAHEINTPIGNALTSHSMLERETNSLMAAFLDKGLTKRRFSDYLNMAGELNSIIRMNLERTIELIKNFKQVAADSYSEPKREFEMKSYMEKILFTMKTTLEKSKHEISVELDEAQMNSYPGAISQVVINLINNSLIHGLGKDEGGRLGISGKKEGDMYRICISDNGVGIPQDNLKRIFDPFFTTKLGKGGSGLGLNIVYNIVNYTLGGTIRCSSLPNVETKFDIEIPLDVDGK